MKKLIHILIKFTIIVLFAALIIMGVVAGFVYHYQDSMIFTQTKFPAGKVYNIPSNYETIVFNTSEGYKYKCWYVKTQNSDTSPTLMYILGNGSYKEAYIKTYNFFAYFIGVNVFSCSNRGSGDYEGKPTEPLLYKDADMFFQYIKDRVGDKPLFIHGRSMGGAVALETAVNHQNEICGLILENTFLSIPKIAREVHPVLSYFLLGFTYLIRTQMENEAKIPKFVKPTLFLISRKDQVVNPKHMDTLYKLSGSTDKEVFENPEGDHHSVESGMHVEFIAAYRNFLSKTMAKCIDGKNINTVIGDSNKTEPLKKDDKNEDISEPNPTSDTTP